MEINAIRNENGRRASQSEFSKRRVSADQQCNKISDFPTFRLIDSNARN